MEKNSKPLPLQSIRLRRARDLLKLLALAPGHRLHREQILGQLWPESHPDSAAHSLYQTLYTLRQNLTTLDPDIQLQFKGEYVALETVGGIWTDIEAFHRAVVEASSPSTSSSMAEISQGLDYYQGDLLPDDGYSDLFTGQRDALRRDYLNLLSMTATRLVAQNKVDEGIHVWQRLVEADPVNEEAHTSLMRAYMQAGQRPKAIHQYEIMRDILYRELELTPSPESRQLYAQIRGQDVVPLSSTGSVPAPRLNLPKPVSSFIGREKEIENIQNLVRDYRLTTLIGTGGVGKTRLALHAADGLVRAFPHGVYWVELATLDGANQVLLSMIQALEIREAHTKPLLEALADYLSQKQLLFIMDNCEHLIAACASVMDGLLNRCPGLHILATSREALGIPGEQLFQVPPLTFPKPGRLLSIQEATQFESVRLFIERAGSASKRFILSVQNRLAVIHICQRLDGMPLAIELAAARQRTMDLSQIASRLDDALGLLTGGSRIAAARHQTLRAMIDWSYELLTPAEQCLFQRLSVFRGGWTLEAVEQVYTGMHSTTVDPPELVDLMRELVNKSLVVFAVGEDEEGRYTMLDTIRQYAWEKLVTTGELDELLTSHLAYYTLLADQAEPFLRGQNQMLWMDRLDREIDNLRLALETSVQKRLDQGMCLAADLMWFWHIRNHLIEGLEWLKNLIAADEARQEDQSQDFTTQRRLQRARALRTLSILGYWHGSYLTTDQLIAIGEESVAILRGLGSTARHELAITLIYQFEPNQRFIECVKEGLSIFRKERDPFFTSESLYLLANDLFYRGELDQALVYLNESLAICREIKDYDGIGSRCATLAYMTLYQGNYQQAFVICEESIANLRVIHNLRAEYSLLTLFLRIATARESYAEAFSHGEKALAFFKEIKENQPVASSLCYMALAAWSQGDSDRAIHLGNAVVALGLDPEYGYNFDSDPNYIFARVALTRNDITLAVAHLNHLMSRIRSSGSIINTTIALEACGLLMAARGQLEVAVMLLGAVDRIYQRIVPGLSPRERQEHFDAVARLHANLGESDFGAFWEKGEALTLDQAFNSVTYVLKKSDSPS